MVIQGIVKTPKNLTKRKEELLMEFEESGREKEEQTEGRKKAHGIFPPRDEAIRAPS